MRLLTLLLFGVPGLFGQGPASGVEDSLKKAEDLYRHTDYRASLTLIRESGRASDKVYYLAGRDYFMLGDYKKAAEAFERAFTMTPGNSEYARWLGRSFGQRAETSPFFAAKYASKARAYFEKAVALDPNNDQALNDLFDYYLEAPGFRGGGYDKAEGIAQRIAERNPAEGHFAEARLADQRTRFDTAEEQFRRVLNLAGYLARHGKISESEAAFDRAAQLEPNSPEVSFARARIDIEQKRNLDRAKALLKQYLQGNLTPDDPSRAQAEKLLKEVTLLQGASGA